MVMVTQTQIVEFTQIMYCVTDKKYNFFLDLDNAQLTPYNNLSPNICALIFDVFSKQKEIGASNSLIETQPKQIVKIYQHVQSKKKTEFIRK